MAPGPGRPSEESWLRSLELVESRRRAKEDEVVAGARLPGGDRDRAERRRGLSRYGHRPVTRADARSTGELRVDALNFDRVRAGRHGDLVEADVVRVIRAAAGTVTG